MPALQSAEATLDSEYSALSFSSNPVDPYQGLSHQQVNWQGTYKDGGPEQGTVNLFWDPKTTNAIATVTGFVSTADGTSPAFPRFDFMFNAIRDDIYYGIP
jgi:hypothetical protein